MASSKSGTKRKLDEEDEIFTNDNDDESSCKIVKVSKSEEGVVEDGTTAEAYSEILNESECNIANVVDEPNKDNADEPNKDNADEPNKDNADESLDRPRILIDETLNSAAAETDELILEGSDDSLTKVDAATNTEEEYVTDLTKLLKGFQKDYQNLEIEEYKQMLQKFYTQNLRLATRCQKLKAAVEKNQTTTTRILREASKQVNPHQLAFISAQLINNGKAPNKRVWSPQMKNIMVGLFRVSPAAFRFLSKALVLPQEEEINQWIGQGTECDLAMEDSTSEDAANQISTIEAQAIIDEIAFENLMATLL